MIDYHVHTSLCNHAVGAMEEYVRQAVAAGLKEICFLDHLTLHPLGAHKSMALSDLPHYYYSVRDIGGQYARLIGVKAGLEADFTPESAHLVMEALQPYDFDVIGGSVHFVKELNIVSRKNQQLLLQRDIDELTLQYLDLMNQMIDHDFADMICHLDVVKKFGRRPSDAVLEKFDALLSKISYKSLVVELNTSGLDQGAGECYPGADLLKKCLALGIPVTLGSDAHAPDQVGRHFTKASALLAATGYRHLSIFSHRSRHDIELNPETI